ncbi:MAG: FAD/NAD(P)-binding protein [Dermabacter sp.]|nr:FAD/NAD(P)-binding protein [Dermabacter sp.]
MSTDNSPTSDGPRTHIAVVGMGPRGTAVVERLVAASLLPDWRGHVSIHVIDPHVGRGGSVWREDQSEVLLMNTHTCQTTMYPDATTAATLGPGLGEAPTFDAFLAGRGYGPTDFAPRREHGRYLAHVLEDAEARSDASRVSIVRHSGEVIDVHGGTEGPQVLTVRRAGGEGDGGAGAHGAVTDVDVRTIEVDVAILSLGHLPTMPNARLGALVDFALRHGLPSAMPNNPLDVDYAQFSGSTRIAVEGMGLNFFDALGMFVDLWGGRFEETPEGLAYRASGREATLIVGSRSGMLYRPKPDLGDDTPAPYVPRVLSDEAVAACVRRRGGVEYEADIVPLIRAELALALTDAGFVEDAEDSAIGERLFPLGRRANEAARAHERTLDQLRLSVQEASAPADERALLVYRVLTAVRRQVNLLVSRGALTPGSFLREWLGFGQNCFASWVSGPPLLRARQLLALAEAGLVEFTGPGMSVHGDDADGLFTVRGGGDAPPRMADAFFAAHLPSVDLTACQSPLVRALAERGEVREARLGGETAAFGPSDGEEGPATGSIDVADTLFPVARDGRVFTTRLFLGVPVSTAQPGSAITAEPGTAAPLLILAERAAREALGVHGHLASRSGSGAGAGPS